MVTVYFDTVLAPTATAEGPETVIPLAVTLSDVLPALTRVAEAVAEPLLNAKAVGSVGDVPLAELNAPLMFIA